MGAAPLRPPTSLRCRIAALEDERSEWIEAFRLLDDLTHEYPRQNMHEFQHHDLSHYRKRPLFELNPIVVLTDLPGANQHLNADQSQHLNQHLNSYQHLNQHLHMEQHQILNDHENANQHLNQHLHLEQNPNLHPNHPNQNPYQHPNQNLHMEQYQNQYQNRQLCTIDVSLLEDRLRLMEDTVAALQEEDPCSMAQMVSLSAAVDAAAVKAEAREAELIDAVRGTATKLSQAVDVQATKLANECLALVMETADKIKLGSITEPRALIAALAERVSLLESPSPLDAGHSVRLHSEISEEDLPDYLRDDWLQELLVEECMELAPFSLKRYHFQQLQVAK